MGLWIPVFRCCAKLRMRRLAPALCYHFILLIRVEGTAFQGMLGKATGKPPSDPFIVLLMQDPSETIRYGDASIGSRGMLVKATGETLSDPEAAVSRTPRAGVPGVAALRGHWGSGGAAPPPETKVHIFAPSQAAATSCFDSLGWPYLPSPSCFGDI